MFRKFSLAVSLLLWLSIAPFFNAVEGNNPVFSNSPKSMCRGCTSCSNGLNGQNGLPGCDGQDGAKGEKGVTGSRGLKGDAGPKGSNADHRNWKQCAWKGANRRDIGLVKVCIFTKKKNNTALRVVFQGNFHLGGCSGCCKRWFITFNGAECSGPLPIDAVNFIRHSNQNNHRHGAIEGYCDNIHKGTIRVEINIGNCAGFGNSYGTTGWNSVSRLIIEEVPPSQ